MLFLTSGKEKFECHRCNLDVWALAQIRSHARGKRGSVPELSLFTGVTPALLLSPTITTLSSDFSIATPYSYATGSDTG